jgi:hypothetical protein
MSVDRQLQGVTINLGLGWQAFDRLVGLQMALKQLCSYLCTLSLPHKPSSAKFHPHETGSTF